MNYFIFNGRNSIDENIIITKMPAIQKPKRRVDSIVIPGKNGTLYEDEECYETIVIQIECTITEKCNIRKIMKWLEGEGKLILSTSPFCYYDANIINKIDYSSIVNILYEFPLEIELQPIAHGVNEKVINITEPTDITITDSTYDIKPYLKIIGNGDISLSINDRSMILKNINEYIEIDCKDEEAFKGKTNQNSCVYSEEFLKLKVGKNNISWLGNVDRIEIKYREAYL